MKKVSILLVAGLFVIGSIFTSCESVKNTNKTQRGAAFGAKEVDAAIRRGMRGGQGFHATENGHEVGTPVYRGVPLERTPGPYVGRMGEVAWQAALDQQTIDNEKRG